MSREALVAWLGRVVDGIPAGGAVLLPADAIRAQLDAEMHLLEAPANEDGPDLTVAEVAGRLKRSPSAVRSWLASGHLGGYRLRGKSWRIPLVALAAFREAQRPNPRPAPTPEPVGTNLSAWRAVRRKKAS